MDEMKARIEARIKQLHEELAAFVEQANRQIAAQQGAIQALEMLLGEMDITEDAGDEEV